MKGKSRTRILALGLVLALGTAIAKPSPDLVPKEFNLATGDAATALTRFSEQSGEQVVFLIDAVQGITTHAVTGRFMPREALEKMVAGTGLVVQQDGPSGALAISRIAEAKKGVEDAAPPSADSDPQSVLMHDYIVAATRVDPHPWRYASLPGIEILTRATDADTAWIVQSIQRGLWVQDRLIAPAWRAKFSVPATLIIDDHALTSAAAGQVHSAPMFFRSVSDGSAWGDLKPRLGFGQVKAYDDDAFATNINLFHVDTSGVLTNSGWGLELRLIHATPALPEWLLAGLIGPFGILRESFLFVPGKKAEHVFWKAAITIQGGNNDAAAPLAVSKILGPGTLWLSIPETRRLESEMKSSSRVAIPLLPMSQLFGPMPADADRQAIWNSQAGLFARWALLEHEEERAQAVARFVQRTRIAPAAERDFVACFGLSYAAAEKQLATLLKDVLGRPTTIPPDFERYPLDLNTPPLDTATADQVGRILGDWLRMKGEALRSENPALSLECFQATGRVLRRAFENDRDPTPGPGGGHPERSRALLTTHDAEFLGVYGLFEEDIGHGDQARKILDVAVRAGATRPGVIRALARLQTDAAATPGAP